MFSPDLLPPFRSRKIHTYAASFGDDIAHSFITDHTAIGDLVLDPFSGSATTLVQARFLGRSAIGIDVDPVACLISRVATTSYSPSELAKLSSKVMQRVEEIGRELVSMSYENAEWKPGSKFSVNGFTASIPQKNEIEFWFAPIQRVLLAVLVEISKSCEEQRHRDVVDLAISASIIRKWPNTLSQARDIDHSRPHRVLRNQLSVDSQLAIFKRAFREIIRILQEINTHWLNHLGTVQIIEGDAIEVLSKLAPNSVDYVLTSPPYFNAIDYPRSHRFSQWWLQPHKDPLTRSSYLGLRQGGSDSSIVELCTALIPSHIKAISWLQEVSSPTYVALCRYVVDVNSVISGLARVVKSRRSVTFILANNAIRGNEIPIVEIVADLFVGNGFAEVKTEQRQIKSSRRRYPYGIRGFQGLMSSEYFIEAPN